MNMLRLLKSKEINIDITNKNGDTPLVMIFIYFQIISTKNNFNEISRFLIDFGANVNKKNNEQYSSLMFCCKNGNKDLAEYLLEHEANVNDSDILGDTPLKLAQKFGYEELALLLINKYKAYIKNRPSSKK